MQDRLVTSTNIAQFNQLTLRFGLQEGQTFEWGGGGAPVPPLELPLSYSMRTFC